MKTLHMSALKKALLLTGALAAGLVLPAGAKVFDNGIDSENLGEGDWIWYISQATNKLGGNVTSVTSIPTLMSYYTNQGLKYIIVKAGQGSTNFPSDAAPQFTTALVNEAHNKGLKIFGYTRSFGVNISGEISIATGAMAKGADGFVIDAEAEWEPLANRASLATQLCNGIKAAYPNRFLAHSPLPYISLHSAFPYKEFGKGCDAVMPQLYWMDLNKTPQQMVAEFNNEWRNWQDSLGAADRDAVKPIIPAGQAYVISPQTYTNGHIKAFYEALKTNQTCVTVGGYRGINWWRTDLHTTAMWTEIRTNSIGGSAPTDGSIVIDNTGATVVGTWSAGTASTDKYGADYRYKGQGTGAAWLQFTPSIPASGNYNVFEWHNQGANRDLATPHVITHSTGSTTMNVNQQVNGGKWNALGLYNFNAGTAGSVKITDGISTAGQIAMADAIKLVPLVSDIILDNPSAYLTGTWTLASSSTDKYGADYRWKGAGTGSAIARFIPNIPLSGNYQVFEWHCQGSNRAINAPFTIAGGGTNTPVVATINQTTGGGMWHSLGTYRFEVGTSGSITLKDNFTGSVGVADAIKLVFISQ